jgi:hypothetical protein
MTRFGFVGLIAILSAAIATPATAVAPARTKTSVARAFIATRSPVGSQAQPYRREGRKIIGPFCSSACLTDRGPSGCGEHVWFYGGNDGFARH